MTAMDGDGIDEELTRAVSVAMIAAARAGEQIARMNQTAAREREARAVGNTIEAKRQLEAHTESARAYFEVGTRPEYLSVATSEQVRDIARQAEGWRERLPDAVRAADEAMREARRPREAENAGVGEQQARATAAAAGDGTGSLNSGSASCRPRPEGRARKSTLTGVARRKELEL